MSSFIWAKPRGENGRTPEDVANPYVNGPQKRMFCIFFFFFFFAVFTLLRNIRHIAGTNRIKIGAHFGSIELM